jgi:putative transposase
MPNTIYSIIEIDSNLCLPSEKVKIKSLSQIMGTYKISSSKLIHEAGKDDFYWHRSFYDSIIRD